MLFWIFLGGNHSPCLWRLTLAPGKVVPPFVFIKMTAKDVRIDHLDGLGHFLSFFFFLFFLVLGQQGKMGGGNHPLW